MRRVSGGVHDVQGQVRSPLRQSKRHVARSREVLHGAASSPAECRW